MNKHILFVLGADDPEMRRIESILKEQGCYVAYAEKDGKRVYPGNAYQADAMAGFWDRVIYVECHLKNFSLPIGAEVMRVDHHREGDPGYGLPPEQFWEASSLGQIYRLLLTAKQEIMDLAMNNAWSYEQAEQVYAPAHDDLVLAAMDHCPANAIRGECPGITAQEVLERKIAEIASATKKSPQEVQERVAHYHVRLMDAPPLQIGDDVLSDLRSEYLGEGYLNLAAMQTAALADGYTVLLCQIEQGGRKKWSISGHASDALIEAFMKEWGPAQCLTGIYGVPSRGYAGGYVPAP